MYVHRNMYIYSIYLYMHNSTPTNYVFLRKSPAYNDSNPTWSG